MIILGIECLSGDGFVENVMVLRFASKHGSLQSSTPGHIKLPW